MLVHPVVTEDGQVVQEVDLGASTVGEPVVPVSLAHLGMPPGQGVAPDPVDVKPVMEREVDAEQTVAVIDVHVGHGPRSGP
jgi:hypothetical protein